MTSGQETDDDDDVVTLLDNQPNDETGLYVVDWDLVHGLPARYEVRFSFSGETWYGEHADAVTACREYAGEVAAPFVARARAETEAAVVRRSAKEVQREIEGLVVANVNSARRETEAAIVRRLAGELGEFEVGPTETLEDVVRHIQGLGDAVYKLVVANADGRKASDAIQRLTPERDDAVAHVARLADVLRGAIALCSCRGTGTRTTPCSMCHDSTWDHECDDREVPCTVETCVSARALLALTEEVASAT